MPPRCTGIIAENGKLATTAAVFPLSVVMEMVISSQIGRYATCRLWSVHAGCSCQWGCRRYSESLNYRFGILYTSGRLCVRRCRRPECLRWGLVPAQSACWTSGWGTESALTAERGLPCRPSCTYAFPFALCRFPASRRRQ